MKFDLRTIRRINFIVAGTVSSAYVIGKALNVNNVKKKLELKKGDIVVPIPPKIQSLIDEVTADMKLTKIQFKAFMCKGSDVKSVGLPLFSTDVYIGIPEYYMFDENDTSPFTVMVNDKEIPQTAPEFRPLKEAMSLSNEAKKFGIAQQIYESQHSAVLPNCIMPIIVVLNCNCLSYLQERFERYTKKPGHISNHFLIFLIGAWMYALLFDVFNIYKETDSDFLASGLGKSYARGGIEYYKKMIKRNTIIKKLDENAPYTEKGDINISYIRTHHMSLERRITYLSELNRGKKESVWNYVLY